MYGINTARRSVSVTHLRSNHAWRARWASLALESLFIKEGGKKKELSHNRSCGKQTKSWIFKPVHSQFLLSVRDVRAVHLFLQVPEKYMQIYECKNTECYKKKDIMGCETESCVCGVWVFGLTGGPFGPGKPVGPWGPGRPLNKPWEIHSQSPAVILWKLKDIIRIKWPFEDSVMVRTLSPGGPGGPSFPELPWTDTVWSK